MSTSIRLITALALGAAAGCSGSSGITDTQSRNGVPVPNGSPGVNSEPSISGSPDTDITVGERFSFAPAASDSDGDTLSFTIQNLPGWASFSESTGQLTGEPLSADIGEYSNILISASDGQATVSLSPFSIRVIAPPQSMVLRWTPPSFNVDGSAVTDLEGFMIYYGPSSEDGFTNAVRVENPGASEYVIDDLQPGSYKVIVTSFNEAGVESEISNTVVHQVNP